MNTKKKEGGFFNDLACLSWGIIRKQFSRLFLKVGFCFLNLGEFWIRQAVSLCPSDANQPDLFNQTKGKSKL
jgi:hypothetical protein